MNDANKKLNLKIEWNKSAEALREANSLLKNHFAGGSISRAYYAAFHATQALLLTEGLEAKSHQGVGRLFSLHFVKSGKFEARFSRILSKSQKFREEADYSSEYVFSESDAVERLKEVQELMTAIKDYLEENHFLP